METKQYTSKRSIVKEEIKNGGLKKRILKWIKMKTIYQNTQEAARGNIGLY